MKVKLLLLILITVIAVSSLFSCRIFSKDDSDGEDSNGEGTSDTDDLKGSYVIFSNSVSTTLIRPEKTRVDLTPVTDAIYDMTGRLAPINTDLTSASGGEILFGETNREISSVAKERLDDAVAKAIRSAEDVGKDTTFIEGYAVYASGGSVAVVWSNSTAADGTVDLFIKSFVNAESLVLPEGYFYVETFDLVELLEEQEAKEREGYLKEIAKVYGDEAATAVDNLWSLYDDRLYLWLADLYDPGEYDAQGKPLGGGFYYSNSARDNAGYDIDLESTEQILSFLTSSGMLPAYDAVLQDYIPEKMQAEMVAFAYSCQSPIDGAFYHPQWGMSISESRKSRDMGWGVQILGHFGYAPYWNTPSGTKGMYGAPPGIAEPTSALTGRLSDSSVDLVSKVVAADDSWYGSEMFTDLETWEKYLQSLEGSIRTKSYSIGNTVSGLASQARQREKMDLNSGVLRDADGDGRAEGGYLDMFGKYFNKWQLAENGLWEPGTVEDGTITYASVNGLMKTIGAYNGFGTALPYAEKALASAVFIVTYMGADVAGAEPTSSVDVYNPWVCIDLVLKNISNYGSAATAANLKRGIQENAVNMINATREKIAKFKKDDGSFGYTWTTSPSTSQGAPVAVPYSVEGDVNGGLISVNGTTKYIQRVFEITMPVYYYSDFLKFINVANSHDPVIKEEGVIIPAVAITFDDDNSAVPAEIIDNMRGGSLDIIPDGRDGADGNVMRFVTEKGIISSFSVNPGSAAATYSLVLEWDMKFDKINDCSGTLFQIKLGDSYMFTCSVDENGTVSYGDQSATSGTVVYSSFGVTANAYEWQNIRVEYYVLDAEACTTVAKFYLNGELRGASSNYTGKGVAATPSISYNGAAFSALNATDMTVLFDNIYATKSDVQYVDEDVINPERIKDFESATVGGDMPAGVTSSGAIVSVPTDENADNKALLISGSGKTAHISSVVGSSSVNCYALTTDIKISGKTLGKVATLAIANKTSDGPIAYFELTVYAEGGETFASLTELNADGEYGNTVKGLPTDEWFELRIEFYLYRYTTDKTTIVYKNGEEIGRGRLYYGLSTIAKTYTAFTLKTTADTEIYLDNVIPERIAKAFVDTDGTSPADPDVELPVGGASSNTAPLPSHDGKFAFDGYELGVPAVPGLQTKTNSKEYGNHMEIALDPKDAANQVLLYQSMMGSNGVGNSFIVQASKKSPAGANCHVLEFDMLVDEFETGGHLQISMKSSYAKSEYTIFNTNCSAKVTDSNTTFTISSKAESSSNTWKKIVSAAEIKGWVNVRFEYYKELGIMQVYYDGVLRGESSYYWSEDTMSMVMTHAVFYTTKETNSQLYFDNVVCESIIKAYTPGTPVADGTPAGDEYVPDTGGGSGGGTGGGSGGNTPATPDLSALYTGFTDFEDHQTATFLIPGITSSLKGGYALVMEDVVGDRGKVLNFTTTSSGQEKIYVDIKANDAGAKEKALIEWWMRFDAIGTKSTYQIFIGDSYTLFIEVGTNGNFSIGDTSSTGNPVGKQSKTHKTGINGSKWQKITVQYDIAGEDCLAKIYVGGMLVAMSNNFYNYSGERTEPAAIGASVTFSATSSAAATMYMDNVTAKFVEEFGEVAVEGDVYTGFTDFEKYEADTFDILGFGSSFVNGNASVVERERDNEVTKVLKFVAASGGNDKVLVDVLPSVETGNGKFVVEWDFMLSDIANDAVYQINLCGVTMVSISCSASKNTFSVSEVQSTQSSLANSRSVKSSVAAGDWHTLKVEYESVEGGCRVLFYFDGDLMLESDRFYNYSGTQTAPSSMGNSVSFSTTSSSAVTMYMDNVTAKFVE